MEPYLLQGLVLPERAQLSLQFAVEFSHVASGVTGVARISLVLNQIAVWIESEHDWDIFDLRNVVKNILQTQLAMVGYLTGYAYDVELTRVLNRRTFRVLPRGKVPLIFKLNSWPYATRVLG
jgi:hypothetical protein